MEQSKGPKLAKKPAWSTDDECRFLRNIGTYSENVKDDRPTLLRKYRSACDQRVNWGKIDQVAVLAHVDKMLSVSRPA